MKLYLHYLGRCEVDKGRILTPGHDESRRIDIPVVAFLIEADDGSRILVDTGMHRRYIDDPQETFRVRSLGRFLTPIMSHHDDIRSRLGEIGIRSSNVDILVSTHFHFDHAGNHADFGYARIVVQRKCYGYAKASPVACPPDLWDLPHLTYEQIDGDWELTAGVTLVETSGHVPGHMSVVVRLPRTGTVVLAIDAICLSENLERDLWRGRRSRAGRRSAHRLAEIAWQEDGMLITGHDPAAWATLKHAPDYYDRSIARGRRYGACRSRSPTNCGRSVWPSC